MKFKNLYFLFTACWLLAVGKVNAQNYHSHNFYLHVELNSGNIYPFAAWSMVSGALNSALSYNLFESGFTYDFYSGDEVRTKYNSPIAFEAVNIFNHFQPGVKIGYYSDYIDSSFNWGILATGGYKVNQFQMEESIGYVRQCIQRAQVGATFLMAFGGNGGSTQAMIEVGEKYNIPVKYKGGEITDTKTLNSGFSTHLALKFGGSGWVQNVGVYADIDHYKLFNNSFVGRNNNLKNTTIGLTVTVTPWQAEIRKGF